MPEAIWSGLVRLATTVAPGPPTIGLPGFRRVLVLAPHPDDETIGCGGTVARLRAGGADVTILVATDGGATIGPRLGRLEIERRRRAEVMTAARVLGVDDVRPLGLPDGDVASHRGALEGALRAIVREIGPDVVFTPWLLDDHADHRTVTRAVLAVDELAGAQVWGYETHTPCVATRVVDITPVSDLKRAALAAHVTAAAAMDLEATLGLNRWRSLVTDFGRGYAEAFHSLTWQQVHDVGAGAGRTHPGASIASVHPTVPGGDGPWIALCADFVHQNKSWRHLVAM